MPDHNAKVLSSEQVDTTTPPYIKFRLKLDNPADAKAIRAAPGFTRVRGRADDLTTLIYEGLVTIEYEAPLSYRATSTSNREPG